MISVLASIILALIVAGFIYWALQELLKLVPLAEPFRTIVRILMMLVLLIIVLWVAVQLLGLVGIHVSSPLGLR